MAASITQDSGSNWTITIAQQYGAPCNAFCGELYGGPADSAEWIEELPTVVGAPQPTLAELRYSAHVHRHHVQPGGPGRGLARADHDHERERHRVPRTYSVPTVGLSFTDTYVPSGRGPYRLVGSDGGIFSFGQAQFYGSTGSLHLQRPAGRHRADDGEPRRLLARCLRRGVFSYGDTQFLTGPYPGSGAASRRIGPPEQPGTRP